MEGRLRSGRCSGRRIMIGRDVRKYGGLCLQSVGIRVIFKNCNVKLT